MWWLLLLLVTIPGIKDLLAGGYFWSHDGPFHLVRLMHFFGELTHGQFPVRLGEQMAYGMGYPTFNYFYPLTYYLGSMIKVTGVSFGDSLRYLNIVAVLVSISGMYLFLRNHFSKQASFLGSVLFMYTPYRFLALYVNGAVGIVLALAIVPWIFWAIDLVAEKKNLSSVACLAAIAFLLPLAHNVSLLIFALPILFYGLLVAIKNKGWGVIKLFVLSGLLAVIMSAFFWLPAIVEMKYVGLGKGVSANYLDNFPSWKQMLYSPWGYGYSNPGTNQDGMSMQIGFANIFVIVVSIGWFIVSFIRERNRSFLFNIWGYFIVLSLVGIFLMSPSSVWLWKKISIMAQIQFPWRILMLVMFSSSAITAFLFDKIKIYLKYIFGLILIGLIIINNRNYLRTWERIRYTDSQFIQNESLFYGSTDIAWEALPTWVKEKPNYKKKIVKENKGVTVLAADEGINPRVKLTTESTSRGKIILNLIYWPGWETVDEKQKIEVVPDSESGLLAITVPSGRSQIEIRAGQTKLENLSNLISLLGFGGWLCVLILGIRENAKLKKK